MSATEHLLKAIGELTAAAQEALVALPPETRKRHAQALESGRLALDVLSSLAAKGATKAREKAKTEAKREAFDEILAALDAQVSRLDAAAAGAFSAVRDAVASAAGRRAGAATSRTAPDAPVGRKPRDRAKPAEARALQRIPLVPDRKRTRRQRDTRKR